ncbi:MAG: hypothetical protein V8R61_10610 [Enterocloster sp.]
MASQQVNAAKLKSTGVNLTNLAAKMKSEMNKLDENIQKVSSVWSGEASASYLKRYQADKANLAQLTQIYSRWEQHLENFPTAIRRQIIKLWILYTNIWANREVSINGRCKHQSGTQTIEKLFQ